MAIFNFSPDKEKITTETVDTTTDTGDINTETEDTTSGSILNNIKSKVGNNTTTVEDIYSYNPSMSTEEAASMNAPSAPDLKPQDYFPDLGERTLQGTYSGPTIGTVSLFAPGGALTPYTVIDAREKALELASLKKAKQIEDFNKAYGKAPVTKHSSVQKEINKTFYDGMQKWVSNAQKKYGDNWASALKNDTEFQSWYRDVSTIKEQEDYLVKRVATIEKEIGDGRFVSTPELDKALSEFRSGISGLAQAKAYPTGYDLNKSILNLETQYELNKIVSDAAKNIEYSIGETLGVDPSNVNYDRLLSEKIKSVDPKELEQAAERVIAQYGGRLSEESKKQVLPMLKRKFPTQVEKQQSTVGKRKPKGAEEVVTEDMLQQEPSISSVDFMMKGGGTQQEEIVGYYGHTFETPVETAIETGTRMLFPEASQGGMIGTKKTRGRTPAVIAGTASYEVIDSPGTADDGRIVTPQFKQRNPKVKTRHETYASGYLVEKDENGQVNQVPFYVPATDVVDAITTKNKSGKIIGGSPLDVYKKKNKELDAGNKPFDVVVDPNTKSAVIVRKQQGAQPTKQVTQPAKTQVQTQTTGPKDGDTKTLKSGKVAIFRNGQWQLK